MMKDQDENLGNQTDLQIEMVNIPHAQFLKPNEIQFTLRQYKQANIKISIIQDMGSVPDCTASDNTKTDQFLRIAQSRLNQRYQIDLNQVFRIDSFRRTEYSNFFIKEIQSQGDQLIGLLYKEGILLYYGPIKNEKANGKDGIMICRYRSRDQENNINEFKGQFLENRANGRGVLVNQEIEFEGKWDSGIPKSGTLKILRQNLELKIQDIRLDNLNHYESGYCQVSLPNKWKYKGDIKKYNQYYQFDGKGEINYTARAGGGSYKGEWKEGTYHGKGKYQWFETNKEYQGHYYKGVKHGQGVEIVCVNNEFIEFRGNWVNGKKEGSFILKREAEYEGGTKISTKVNYKNGVIVEDFVEDF